MGGYVWARVGLRSVSVTDDRAREVAHPPRDAADPQRARPAAPAPYHSPPPLQRRPPARAAMLPLRPTPPRNRRHLTPGGPPLGSPRRWRGGTAAVARPWLRAKSRLPHTAARRAR